MNAVDSKRLKKRRSRLFVARAFSLVEVVLAIGVAAVAVISVVALYRPVVESVGEVRDGQTADRVLDAIHGELQRLPFATVETYVANGTVLYASRTGDRVGTDEATVWLSLAETAAGRNAGKFHECILLRNAALSPASGPATGSLAFTVQLRWPAHRADGQRVTDDTLKQVRLAPMAVTR